VVFGKLLMLSCSRVGSAFLVVSLSRRQPVMKPVANSYTSIGTWSRAAVWNYYGTY